MPPMSNPQHATSPVGVTIEGQPARPGRFEQQVESAQGSPLTAKTLATIQANIGLTCNLACRHCHLESSPARPEQMDWPTMQLVLDAARRSGAATLDITGGAPEMNPHFRQFVAAARKQDLHVMVRTNLTIMLTPHHADLPGFYRDHAVHLVASLPCYLETDVDRQRGRHVYHDSIEVIRQLNAHGYGQRDDLPLDLVYNPLGPNLPPNQAELQATYRRELHQRFGITFTRLYTITNMAIGRFLHTLLREGRAEAYQRTLREAFNPATLESLMCRHQLHVSWDGTLHDCDFSHALHRPVADDLPQHLRDFDDQILRTRPIATGEHCFGCTAGCGSSCGGSLV
ncbi:MAG: arsenosugar biosynthesis radical SAM (seleno)protein ArsS [Phycisphaeraceae bacterium]